jgi:formylglycine-generating enzyme required for sulfatase activity
MRPFPLLALVPILVAPGCSPAKPNAMSSDPVPSADRRADAVAIAAAPPPYTQAIPGTALAFDMVPVADGRGSHLFVSRTEITWDVFDVFVYRLDGEAGDTGGADAVTRPSKPYIAMDRGFGHTGFPALSMSAKGAQAFCEWLTMKTGRAYRLPTEEEWGAMCAASGISPDVIDEHAWYDGNADRRTHPVATKAPDASGLADLIGNAAEWCVTDDGSAVVRGGSYLTAADEIGCPARDEPKPAWNASDPQFPQSVWWYADAGFVGFRVVCDGD